METVTEARMRHFGATKTAVIVREPSGEQLYGFPLGRLYKRDYISKAQYAAGNRFAEVVRAYMLSKGIGSPTEGAQDLNRRGASLSDRPVQHEDEARAFIDALAEVDRQSASKRTATSLVWDVCLREYAGHMDASEIGRMREGLNAIARVIDRRQRLLKKAA